VLKNILRWFGWKPKVIELRWVVTHYELDQGQGPLNFIPVKKLQYRNNETSEWKDVLTYESLKLF